MDGSRIGKLASEAWERIAEDHDGATIRTVTLLVEVDAGEQNTEILVFSDETRLWVQRAFVDEVLAILEARLAAASIREEE